MRTINLSTFSVQVYSLVRQNVKKGSVEKARTEKRLVTLAEASNAKKKMEDTDSRRWTSTWWDIQGLKEYFW